MKRDRGERWKPEKVEGSRDTKDGEIKENARGKIHEVGPSKIVKKLTTLKYDDDDDDCNRKLSIKSQEPLKPGSHL